MPSQPSSQQPADSLLTPPLQEAIARESLAYFLKYVQIPSASSPTSTSTPSTPEQWDMLRTVARDLEEMGLTVTLDETQAFVYATVPGNQPGTPFGLCAHVDTSPDQSGTGVVPVLHENYSGGEIRFAKDPNLVLSPAESEELADFAGQTIITASGDTLLGADDKAGVAEIVAAARMWQQFPDLPHPDVTLIITRDEEVGRGVDGIDTSRLPRFCYTMDGGYPGELEYECFDAYGVSLTFQGKGVHPGYAKDKMINAAVAAARFVSLLPRQESPEHTEGREGFYHVSRITGDNETASVVLILRDFEKEINQRRLQTVRDLKAQVEQEFPGLSVDITEKHQYANMREYLQEAPEVIDVARRAIQATGLTVIERPIRGGTDGSRLSAIGYLTPNIFAGGLMFHSRVEWIAAESLAKATETILHLGKGWCSEQG